VTGAWYTASALAIVDQDFEGGGASIAKDIECTAERVVSQGSATHASQSINAATQIDRLDRHEDPTLGTELEHQGRSKKARTKSTSGGCGSR
jgi:hypothetical protein